MITDHVTIGPTYSPSGPWMAETRRSSVSGPTRILARCGRRLLSASIARWWCGFLWNTSNERPSISETLIGRCCSIVASVVFEVWFR
ncbi:hypothetical protein CHKEEEPN_4212 [Methylorubrum podarium]|nr:hypothetical protein CHKEEEPN_4212 [Methylorubrum podarium]